MSFWEHHKARIYKYGHIYATIYGLPVINYIHEQPTNGRWQFLAKVYSHVLNLLLIVVLPVYFAHHISSIIETSDRRWKLHLAVEFANTIIKYVMVIVTYMANFAHYNAIREITGTRQQVEDAFRYTRDYSADPVRRNFEGMLLFKFGLINVMMILQVAAIVYQHCVGVHPVRVQIAIYTFFLWNYIENMADYFYFINCSALKFYRQLDEQLQRLMDEVKRLPMRSPAMRMHLACDYSDRLDMLASRYQQVHKMSADSVTMHQFQLLGVALTTLITNLTNLFTLYNLLVKNSVTDATPQIVRKTLFALVYYVDTYIVALISEQIGGEMHNLYATLKQFNEVPNLDVRLEQTAQKFGFMLCMYKGEFHICGLFKLNRRLTYLTAFTCLSYFFTLVQFDMKKGLIEVQNGY